MASGEPEDLDLDALRLAALATFKKRSNELGDKMANYRGKDEEDLDQLRKMALQSKKGPDATPDANRPIRRGMQKNNFKFFGGFLRDKAYGHNSNLIVIKTIPLEEPSEDAKCEKPLLLKPQDRFCHLTDEDASSSPQQQKWKATGKFSRFDSSSSDSEDSEEDFDFTENRTDQQSSDENDKDSEKEESRSSSGCSEDELQICEESCDQFVNSADDGPQTEANGSTTDDKIPRVEINGQCKNKGPTGKDSPTVSSGSERNGSRAQQEYKSARRNQHETRSNLRHMDGKGSLSDNSKRKQVSVCKSKYQQRRRDKAHPSEDLRSERAGRSRHNPKCILGNMEVDPEKLEARRRKFFDSDTTPVAPTDGKISLRGIVSKSKTKTPNPKKSRGQDSAKLPKTLVKSAVSVTGDFGGKENSRKGEKRKTDMDDRDAKLVLRRTDEPSPPTLQTDRIKPCRTKSSGRNPVIKSVLNVVKVDGKSTTATISSGGNHIVDHPTAETTQTAAENSKSMRRKALPDSSLTEKRTKDYHSLEKRRHVTLLDDEESQGECCERLNIIIQKDSQPALPNAKSKVPIHLRLGQPICAQSTTQSSNESSSPARAVHLQVHTCEDASELSASKVPMRSPTSNSSHANKSATVDVPSSAYTHLSSGQLPPSPDVSGIECESALDAKIRKIQERNEAILRRQEEVVADKLLYG